MNKIKILTLLFLCMLLSGCSKATTVFSVVGIDDHITMIRIYQQDINWDLKARFDGNPENNRILLKEYELTGEEEIDHFLEHLNALKCDPNGLATNSNFIITDYLFIDAGDKTFCVHVSGKGFSYDRLDYSITGGSTDFLKTFI